jgi:hypothetical protein
MPLLRSSRLRAVFVFFSVVSWLKEKNLKPRNDTKIHEIMRKLIQLRVDPFALTACRLPQKTNPKSEIQNPKSKCAGFCIEDQRAHPIPRMVLTMRTPTPDEQQRTTNHKQTGNAAVAAPCRQLTQAVLPATDRNLGTICNCGKASHFSYLISHISHCSPSAFRRYHEAELRCDGHFLGSTPFSQKCVLFPKQHGFPENAYFSKSDATFPKMRTFLETTWFS